MSDDDILDKGGVQEDISNYAHDAGGACGAIFSETCDHPTCEYNKNNNLQEKSKI